MTATTDALTQAVQAATRSIARRGIGSVVGAFAGPQTVVQAAGPVSGVFQIGSVTKVFTTLALADAVARGELSLDTPLAALLPQTPTPATGAPITLGHLATHTSGLPRLPPRLLRRALRSRADPYRDVTTEYLLDALAATRLRSEPGTRVRYSNFGAALLGHALSRHTSRPYAQLVAERITGPLAMPDTAVDLQSDQKDRKAIGHSRRRPVPDWHLGAMSGAGALYSTVPDLLTLLRAHLEPDRTALPDALRLVQQPGFGGTDGCKSASAGSSHPSGPAGTRRYGTTAARAASPATWRCYRQPTRASSSSPTEHGQSTAPGVRLLSTLAQTAWHV